MSLSPYEISEIDVDITGKTIRDDEDVFALWCKNQIIRDKMVAYWQPYLDAGKKYWDYFLGNIFTDEQREEMRVIEEKIPVEPRLMQPRIMALVGEIMQGRRSGAVTTEGGSIEDPAASAAIVEIANIVLKDMEKKTRERTLVNGWLFNALVSCFFNWIWYDKSPAPDGEGVLTATLLPWDSTVVGPFNIKNADGSDITEIIYVDYIKEAELLLQFPDMAEEIKQHRSFISDEKVNLLSKIANWSGTMDATDLQTLHYSALKGVQAALAPDGFLEVFTRVFQVIKKEKIAFDLLNPKDFHVRPGEWQDDRWQSFIDGQKAQGKSYEEAEREVKVLWVCRWTSCGLMIENKKHWYQENGALPGVPYLPAMFNGRPSGPSEIDAINVLMSAVYETEYLHEMRLGSNSIFILREGTVTNLNKFPTEVSKKNGVITVAQESGAIDSSIREIKREPNKAALEYSQKLRGDIEESDRINQSMQGASAPRQSAIAKNMELAQGLIAQSQYVENLNASWERLQNLKCSFIPYGYNQFDIVRVIDETTGETKVATINEPMHSLTGDVETVSNDLTAHTFKYKITPVDDSPTAKQREREQAMVFLNSVPGPILSSDPSGKMLARFMMSFPDNRFLQGCGQAMMADAGERQTAMSEQEKQKTQSEMQVKLAKIKVEAEKVKKAGFSLGITGEQLVQFPMLTSFLTEAGLLQAAQPVAAPGASAQPPAPMPQEQSVPQEPQMVPA